MLVEVKPNEQSHANSVKGVAARVSKLWAAVESFDIWSDPERSCLIVPKLAHIHQEQKSSDHNDVRERVQPIPADQKYDNRGESDDGSNSNIRVQIPNRLLAFSCAFLDFHDVVQTWFEQRFVVMRLNNNDEQESQ